MSYIGNQPTTVAFVTDTFSGNGSTVAFTMSQAPATTTSIIVSITGVLQDPSTYAVSGTTLTFSAAPPSGASNISVRFLGIPASGVTTTAYRTVTEFTATAGQTTFSVPSYTVGYIDVYRNGVMLGSADYTASNGTTVVLAAGATAGDLVETISFYVSSVLNAIPAQANSVGTTYIADSAITTAKIAAGAVVQADIATGVAGTGPAFNARVDGTQSLSANVATKLNFSLEDFDTNNCFNTATYRFTPNVAGYYQFIVQTYGSATTGFSTARLYKNGSVEKEGVLGIPVAAVGTICSVVGLVYMNGTTDYIEAYGYQSVNTTINGTGSVTFFSGSMVRAA